MSLKLSIVCVLLSFGLISLSACDDDKVSPNTEETGGMSGGTASVVQGSLSLEQPLEGQFLNSEEVTVTGVHSSANEVLINGTAVPVTNQRFSKVFTLEEGPQLIEVSAGPDQIAVNILVDLTAPEVLITEPSYGSHIDSSQTPTVTLIGSVQDQEPGSGVETILINGQEVLIETNGRFQFTYAPENGLNRPLVIARDRAGNESTATRGFLYGRYKAWGNQIERGIRGEMKPEAFDVVAVTLENALKSNIINELIEENSDFSEDIVIEDIIFQDIDVQLVPANGFIDIQISFFDLKIFFELNSPSARGEVYISPAILSAELTLAPNSDGTLNAQLVNPAIELENLVVRTDNSLIDTALSFVEGFIVDFAEDTIIAALEEALLDQLISPTLFSPTLDILGVEVQVGALFKQINITSEAAQVDLGVQISDLPAINNSVGYLTLPNDNVPPRLQNMASADISQNTLYLIFSHLWHGGLFNVTLDEITEPPSALSAAVLNGFTDGRLIEYMSPTDIIGIRLRPMLPPITRFDLTRPNAIVIDFVDLHVDLTTPDQQTWFTLGIDISATVIPQLLNNRLGLNVNLIVDGVKVDEPLFPVRSEELILLVTNYIKNLPDQLGDDGLRNLFDLNEIDFYGLNINSGTVQGVEVPAPYLQMGIDLRATIQ